MAPVTLTPEGRASPLSAFAGGPVLHWHGDDLDLPSGGVRLAATADCPVQAFALGSAGLGVQFHPEAGGPSFERWLVGHAVELAAADIDVASLRADHARAAPHLRAAAETFLEGWLRSLVPDG